MVSVIVSDHCILYIVCPTAELKITLLQHFRLNMDTLSYTHIVLAGTSNLAPPIYLGAWSMALVLWLPLLL